MKKQVLFLLLLGMLGYAYAGHRRYFRSGDDINTGTVSNARLDSSVTIASTRTQVYSDEGSILTGGNVTRVDCGGSEFACTQSGSTVTITHTPSSLLGLNETTVIIVGTSSVRGADVIGTTTEVFNFAIASGTGRGTVFVQAGDYYYTRGTTVSNITFVFEDSATIKYGGDERINTAFFISTNGRVINPYIYLDTAVVTTDVPPLIRMISNGYLGNPHFSIRLSSFSGTWGGAPVASYGGVITWDADSQGSIVENMISSFTFAGRTVGGSNFGNFVVRGGTGNLVINPIVDEPTNLPSNYTNSEIMFQIFGTNGFEVRGGRIKTARRVLSTENAATRVRGLKFSGTNIEFAGDPHANGLFYIQNNAITFSSGIILNDLQIYFRNATTAASIVLEAATSAFSEVSVNGVNVHHSGLNTSSGGGFTIVNSSVLKTIFTNNRITGTTGCISDSGTLTRWAGNDNFCNGNEQ